MVYYRLTNHSIPSESGKGSFKIKNMIKILLYLLLLPIKNRPIGLIALFIGLVLFFRYFDLQPSGEEKEITVGPVTFHVNPVELHRRVAKPIDGSANTTTDAIAPSSISQNQTAGYSNTETPGAIILPTMPDDSSIGAAPSLDASTFDVGPIDSSPAPANAYSASAPSTPAPTTPIHSSAPSQLALSRSGAPSAAIPVSFAPPAPVNRQQIRIGTVCLNRMNLMKFSDPTIQETLVRMAREFDLLAVQGFYDSDLQVVDQWARALNADGGTYSYLAAYPPAFKQDKNYQAPFVAFIFNRRAVDADKNTLLVLESGTRMSCAPIAALFTARSTDKYPAFTFIAMNVWINPSRPQAELSVLSQTFSMLQDHISGEDDVVILGDFGINVNYTPEIVRNAKLSWAFTRPMLNYYNQNLNSNILFYNSSCTEFQSQAGTFAVDRLTSLPVETLRSFMPNPPVWGLFSVREAKEN